MASSVSTPLFLLLLFFATFIAIRQTVAHEGKEEFPMKPALAASSKLRSFIIDEHHRRRQLSNFQICSLCTCCGGPRGICLPSPCCYALNCNIPNRPFGFCSFTPKTCNCFGCHV